MRRLLKSHALALCAVASAVVSAGVSVALAASANNTTGEGAGVSAGAVAKKVETQSAVPTTATTAATAVPATSWAKVGNAPGELSLWRAVTSYALTCDVAEFPRALEESAKWSKARADVAQRVLLQSWVTRETEAAIVWRGKVAWTLSDAARTGLYRGLAVIDAKRALELAKTETSRELTENAENDVLDAVVNIDPRRALELARDPRFFGEMERDRAVIRVVFQLTFTDPRAAFIATQKISSFKAAGEVRPEIFGELFKANPAEAISVLKEVKLDDDERTRLVVQIVGYYGASDLKAMDALMENEKDPAIKKLIGEGIENVLGRAPRSVAWEYKRARGWPSMGPELSSRLAEYAIGRPREEARAFFKSASPSLVEGKDEIASFARSWTAVDVDAALAWASKLKDSDSIRGTAFLGVTRQLLVIDPARALKQIESMPAGYLRSEMARLAMNEIGQRDPSRALAWVMRLPAGMEQNGMLSVIADIGILDNPAAMASSLGKLPSGAVRTEAISAFSQAWSLEDPVAATNWLLKLPQGADRAASRRSVFENLATYAPEVALREVETLPVIDERGELLGSLAGVATEEHPMEVIAAIKSLPIGHERFECLRDAFIALMEPSPQLGAELTLQGAFEFGEFGIFQTAQAWAISDPSSAAQWLDSLPANQRTPASMTDAQKSIVNLWAFSDPEAALAWVNKWPDSAEKERERVYIAQTQLSNDPSRGLDVLVSVGASREDLVAGAQRLFNISPADAKTWINSSALSPELKVELIEGMTR